MVLFILKWLKSTFNHVIKVKLYYFAMVFSIPIFTIAFLIGAVFTNLIVSFFPNESQLGPLIISIDSAFWLFESFLFLVIFLIVIDIFVGKDLNRYYIEEIEKKIKNHGGYEENLMLRNDFEKLTNNEKIDYYLILSSNKMDGLSSLTQLFISIDVFTIVILFSFVVNVFPSLLWSESFPLDTDYQLQLPFWIFIYVTYVIFIIASLKKKIFDYNYSLNSFKDSRSREPLKESSLKINGKIFSKDIKKDLLEIIIFIISIFPYPFGLLLLYFLIL